MEIYLGFEYCSMVRIPNPTVDAHTRNTYHCKAFGRSARRLNAR